MARKEKYKVEEVIAACADTGGVFTYVAARLGTDRATVARYAKRYKVIRDALHQADEAITDLAETQHRKLIGAGYWPAIEYRLKTKGKARGYVERQEVTGADGGKLEIKASVSYTIDEAATILRGLAESGAFEARDNQAGNTETDQVHHA